jgi:hypothetical protein
LVVLAYERIGKVIGDAFSALLVLTFIAIFAYSLLGRILH